MSAATTWTLLGTWGGFEYWTPDMHHGHTPTIDAQVYRRKVSSYNYLSAEGSPVGARWDSSLTHFQLHVAGRLPV